METLIDRAIFFALGCAFGLFLSYLIRYLREIKEELHEVNETVHDQHDPQPERKRDERGAARVFTFGNVALALVVALTAFAAFRSQQASNDTAENQRQQAQFLACNQMFLGDLLEAVNERTTYSREQTRANIELQKAQSAFVSVLVAQPPKTEPIRFEALRRYSETLTEFVEVYGKAASKQESNPYPTVEAYQMCLMKES